MMMVRRIKVTGTQTNKFFTLSFCMNFNQSLLIHCIKPQILMHIRPFTLSNGTSHCEHLCIKRPILVAGGGHHHCLNPLIKYEKGIEQERLKLHTLFWCKNLSLQTSRKRQRGTCIPTIRAIPLATSRKSTLKFSTRKKCLHNAYQEVNCNNGRSTSKSGNNCPLKPLSDLAPNLRRNVAIFRSSSLESLLFFFSLLQDPQF